MLFPFVENGWGVSLPSAMHRFFVLVNHLLHTSEKKKKNYSQLDSLGSNVAAVFSNHRE